MTKLEKILVGISIIAVVLSILFGSLYFNQKDRYKNLFSAAAVNEEFITKFFNYNETSERYTNVKELMSKVGYQQLFPSGISMPTSKIQSNTADLTIFENPSSSEKPEFISRFNVKTTFQGVSSNEDMVLKTRLKSSGDTWVVDDVEILADVPADEE